MMTTPTGHPAPILQSGASAATRTTEPAALLPAPALGPEAAFLAWSALQKHDATRDGTRSVTDIKQRREEAARKREEHLERTREMNGAGKKGLFGSIAEIAEHAVDNALRLRVADLVGDVKGDFSELLDNPRVWKEIESAAGEVAKWGAVAASCVVAVGSFGGCTALAVIAVAGVVFSMGGATESSFHVLERVGVDRDTATTIGVSLSVGGSLLSGGASAAGSIVGSGGVAASSLGSTVSSGATQTARALDAAKQTLAYGQAAATLTRGTSGSVVVAHASERDSASADAAAAEHAIVVSDRNRDRVLDALRSIEASCQRTTRSVMEMASTRAQTAITSTRRFA